MAEAEAHLPQEEEAAEEGSPTSNQRLESIIKPTLPPKEGEQVEEAKTETSPFAGPGVGVEAEPPGDSRWEGVWHCSTTSGDPWDARQTSSTFSKEV
jgi:hypothetical protein